MITKIILITDIIIWTTDIIIIITDIIIWTTDIIIIIIII